MIRVGRDEATLANEALDEIDDDQETGEEEAPENDDAQDPHLSNS
jgi:hypothetical protein